MIQLLLVKIVSSPDSFYKAFIILIQTMNMLMGQTQGTQSRQVINLKTTASD